MEQVPPTQTLAQIEQMINQQASAIFSIASKEIANAKQRISKMDLPDNIPTGFLVGFLLWKRAVSSYEAALLLTENGFSEPALSNVRTATECIFYACALWEDPEAYKKLFHSDYSEVTKFKNSVSANKKVNLIPEVQAMMDSTVKGIESKEQKKWGAKEAADLAGLSDIYDSSYRLVSAMGVHATAVSITDYFVSDGSGGVVFDLNAKGRDFSPLIGTLIIQGIQEFSKRLDQALPLKVPEEDRV